MTDFPAIAHVAVTVSDLNRSVPWYRELIGTDPVLDEDTEAGFHHTVFLVGGTLLGLHAFPDGVPAGDAFEARRLGLDHVAFGLPDRAALQGWEKRLDDLGVAHGGIVDAHYGSGLSFRDPD